MSRIIKMLSLSLLLLASSQAFAAWPVVSENFIDEDLYQYRGSERLQGSYWDDRAGVDGARKSISITTGMTLTGARLKELARRGVQFNARDLTKISGATASDAPSYSGPRAGLRIDVAPNSDSVMTSQTIVPEVAVPPVRPNARIALSPSTKVPLLTSATRSRTVSASSAIKNLRMLQGR